MAKHAVPMLNRRGFLAATAGFVAGGLALPDRLLAAGLSGIELAAMRGSIDAADLGVRPGALDDQSKAFAKMLQGGIRPRRAGFPACRHLCRIEPGVAEICAAFRRAGRHTHRLWRRRSSDDRRGCCPYRADRAGDRWRQPLARRSRAGHRRLPSRRPRRHRQLPDRRQRQIRHRLRTRRRAYRALDGFRRRRGRHLFGRRDRPRHHREHRFRLRQRRHPRPSPADRRGWNDGHRQPHRAYRGKERRYRPVR